MVSDITFIKRKINQLEKRIDFLKIKLENYNLDLEISILEQKISNFKGLKLEQKINYIKSLKNKNNKNWRV